MKRSSPPQSPHESLWPASQSDLDGWHLSPEGAAIHLHEQTAVIADVHLGYEWVRGSRGDMVPAHSLPETLAKLSALFRRAQIKRLIVAGDLVESRRPCLRTRQDVKALEAWLANGNVELIILQGNHDPLSKPPRPLSIVLRGWTITHGHLNTDAPRLMVGHHHPALKGEGILAPCFLVSESLIVLPAFSQNAAGLDVTSSALPTEWNGHAFRLFAGLDGVLLDFGPLSQVRSRLRNE